MFKKVFLSLFLVLSLVSFAQQGTSSPYSFYGIGDVRFRGNIENRSMGEVSVIPDSIHLNLHNPAMMADIKLTTFGVGGTFSPVYLKTANQKEKAQKTTLDYLSVVLPANKLAFGFGLMPYSSVGYNIVNTVNSRTNTFSGTGGVNKVYSSVSYKLFKQVSIGAEFQYNFGEIETRSTSSASLESATRETNISNVSGVNFNFGLSHQAKISKKISIFSGITYKPEATLTLENTRNIAVVQISGLGVENVIEQEDVTVANSKLKTPSKLTFGTGLGELKKWAFGVQYSMQSSSDFGNRYQTSRNVKFEEANKFSVGGYYIPKYTSFTNYLSRITYRAGFRYENTGLVINNISILDRATTFGLGLPINGTFSNINIGFEFGKRGTTNAGLILENYYNFNIGLSFNDRWFIKRKYD
jgi:hypothetical protein